MVLAHLACGSRVVMRAHDVTLARANSVTWALVLAGLIVAVGIAAALVGWRT